MSGATRIDSATNGLSVTVGDDGAWVEFTTQTGKHFCFQPAQEFNGRSGIGGDVVRDWCLEMQARRTAPKPEDSTAGAVSAAQHTPGPWAEFADRGDTVAIMAAMREDDVCNFAPPYPSRANGRLIAAAPKLLDALREVVFAETERLHAADNDRDYLAQQTRMATALAFARAVLSRATGAA